MKLAVETSLSFPEARMLYLGDRLVRYGDESFANIRFSELVNYCRSQFSIHTSTSPIASADLTSL